MNKKTNIKKVRTILLDFGGVLFNITSAEAWLRDHINPLLGMDLDMEAFNELYHTNECGKSTGEELKRSMESLSGRKFSTEEFERAWNGILLDMPEESLEIVRNLSERYDLYLLSNTNATHYISWWRTIEDQYGPTAFASAFKGFFYSHELGIIKPSIEIYRKVHELIGSPDKESCLFFDDKLENVIAAQNFGWNAAHVDLSNTNLTALANDLDLI